MCLLCDACASILRSCPLCLTPSLKKYGLESALVSISEGTGDQKQKAATILTECQKAHAKANEA